MTNDRYGDGYYYGSSMYGALASGPGPFTPDPLWDPKLRELHVPGPHGAHAL